MGGGCLFGEEGWGGHYESGENANLRTKSMFANNPSILFLQLFNKLQSIRLRMQSI